MEALMQDLNLNTKKDTSFVSVMEAMGYDTDIPGPSYKRQLLADQSTFSLSGQSAPIFPASNQQPTLNLRQQNVVIDTHQTFITGRFACPTGVINSQLGYGSIFQPLELQLGDGIRRSYAFPQYQYAIKKASEYDSHESDFASGSLYSSSDTFVPSSFDSYAVGTIPTIKNVISGTGSTTSVETLDPYQIAMRKNIDSYLAHHTGQFMTLNGIQYPATTFAVPLSEICDFFKTNRFIYLGLGQSLRMVLKCSDKSEVVYQCFNPTSVAQDYALEKMGVLLSYIPVSELGNDLSNILRSRIELHSEKAIPFQVFSLNGNIMNLQFSLSAGAKLRSLEMGFFSAMTSANVLSDSTNTVANILPSTDLTARCQYHTNQLGYFPMPPIQQVTIQVGSHQVIINSQSLQFLDKMLLSYRKQKSAHDSIWRQLMNPLVIDLTRYTEELDLEGASSGGSTSLLVSVAFLPGTSSGTQTNNNRTLPYQQSDWTTAIMSSLKCMAYANVLEKNELVNGIYQA